MKTVQNNFSATNKGNFANRKIDNMPPRQKTDKLLSNSTNQSGTGIRKTGNFNSKAITQ